jgi:hypothetical protein
MEGEVITIASGNSGKLGTSDFEFKKAKKVKGFPSRYRRYWKKISS